jgi:uroporphyrinogen-III synthase
VNASRSLRILVTRAEPGASATARALGAKGYAPIVEPLFALQPVAADLPRFDALAFTSANGVRAFAGLSARRDAPVFCVGRRTADAAREAGFADVASADGDVVALTALIQGRLPADATLLHAGNEDSRGDLAGTLKAAGFKAEFRALYRAEPVAAPGPALAAFLAGEPAFDAVLIHSPRGGAILAGFAADAAASTPADGPLRLSLAAISPAAAAPLRTLAARIEVAATPDETSLLAALERLAAQD